MFRKHLLRRFNFALLLSSLLLLASVSLVSAAPPKDGLMPNQPWAPGGGADNFGGSCYGTTTGGNVGNNIIWGQAYQYCDFGPQQMTTYIYRCGWVVAGECFGSTQVQAIGSNYSVNGGGFWNPNTGANYSSVLPSGTYIVQTHHISWSPVYVEGWSTGPLITI